jgi:hypothetical protein
MGGGVDIAVPAKGREQLGQSSVCPSYERSNWCRWQQEGQAVQNGGACGGSPSCSSSAAAGVSAARGGRLRFDGGVADTICRGWGAGGGEAG